MVFNDVTNTHKGREGERRAITFLQGLGYRPRQAEPRKPFDLLLGKKRIEVKTGELVPSNQQGGGWKFNIHRHGKLQEQEVDYYLFELLNCPRGTPYMLVEAPIGRTNVYVSADRYLQDGYTTLGWFDTRKVLPVYDMRIDRTQGIATAAGGRLPRFILTASMQPTQAEIEANRALLQRFLQRDGFIRLRLPTTVYDPDRKQYVHLRGESINLNVFNADSVEDVLGGIRKGLLAPMSNEG